MGKIARFGSPLLRSRLMGSTLGQLLLLFFGLDLQPAKYKY